MIKTPMQSNTSSMNMENSSLNNSKDQKKFAEDVSKALKDLLETNAQNKHTDDEFCIVSSLNDSNVSADDDSQNNDDFKNFTSFKNLERFNFKFEKYTKPKID